MGGEAQAPAPGGIAIVGMAVRFPGARNIEEFWANLRDGVESVRTLTDEEMAAAGVSVALYKSPRYVRRKGILDDAALFDAGFFGIAPLEAKLLDPQHRLLLECSWEALERAGHRADRFAGPVGVYAAVGLNTYLLRNVLSNLEMLDLVGGYQMAVWNDKDFAPTRVSYHLDLRGPSLNVNTACSGSLVAVHLACQGLLTYECDMALAGGVTVEFPQEEGVIYREGMVYSEDGRCRAFDADAQGIVDGNGVGIVVLRRLEDALRDRDVIHAVIRGTAINNDGRAKIGYTAPSVSGQAEVIAQAQAMAGCDPDSISYIEAHGTATPLGDPIEVAALTQVFRAKTDRRGFCGLGSVKSNLGHLDSAAGVAGLVKTVLSLEHRQLVPSLHFRRPNPKIDFADGPFYVCTRLADWPRGATPRRAGVSSFGIGGTNAHVVLEEAPAAEPAAVRRRWQILTLAARSEAAVAAAGRNLAAHLERTEVDLADVAYTLQIGRKPFEWRCAVVSQRREEAAAALAGRRPGLLSGTASERPPAVVFLFPGQGAQHVGMTREIYEVEPVYRRELDRCAEALLPVLGRDLRSVIFADAADSQAAELLQSTAWAQPALFAVEHSLARLWQSWGVAATAMIGHSLGEYVAACLAGVLSLEDALRLVALRGRLMASLPPGRMLAVGLARPEVEPLLGGEISLAAVNETQWCVVSGPEAAVGALERELDARGVSLRTLHTSHAFHSAMMDPILGELEREVARCRLSPPALPYVSNLTGKWITRDEAVDPLYWRRHLRETVLFAAGLEVLMREAGGTFLEVGPGVSLAGFVQRHPARTTAVAAIASLPHSRSVGGDEEALLATVARLWLRGHEIDWTAFHDQERLRRVPLPTYPFEHQKHYLEIRPDRHPAPARAAQGRRPAFAISRMRWSRSHSRFFRQRGREASERRPRHVARARPAENGARPALATHYVAPRNLVEEQVAHIWEEFLGITPIGMDDNFFELGGHSLLATRLLVRVNDVLGVDLPLASFFAEPSVAGVATAVLDLGAAAADASRLASLLEQLEGMSDEAAQALLEPSATADSSKADEAGGGH